MPRRPEVQQARAAVARRGGQVITLGPLADTDVAALVTAMVGASPGDGLRRMTAQAAGNPFYVRELVDALLREQAVRISPVAEIVPAGEQLPVSLAAVLEDRLSSVSAVLLRALLTAGDYQEAVGRGRRALAAAADPARQGETFWMLAHAQISVGDSAATISTMRQALATAGLPLAWQARVLALLAQVEREPAGVGAADSIARQALAAAEEAGDELAAAHALNDLWLTSSVARDHPGALDCIDRVLSVMGDDPAHADLHAIALDSRTFTLQNLDEWPRAELSLQQAREFAQRNGRPDRATWATVAVLRAARVRPGPARGGGGALPGGRAARPPSCPPRWRTWPSCWPGTAAIARGLFLSRRTVQTYISHILAKLEARSRVDIVREALRQGIVP